MTTINTSPAAPRIAIIGAGPGGLLAARILERGGLHPQVFDADLSAWERNPGGTLDLHADSGQIAIDDAHLTEGFIALARPESQAKRLVDPASGHLLKEFAPDADTFAAPEIDRGQLRQLLADSVGGSTVQWRRKLLRVEPASSGGWRLAFADGSVEEADIVLGADGAWSRVRRMLTDARPQYTGVSFVEIVFTDVDSDLPAISQLVGDGHLWANGDGKNIILQRNSGGVVRGYVGIRTELDWLARAGLGIHDGHGGVVLDDSGLQRLDNDAVRSLLLERFSEFAPQLRDLIRHSEGVLNNRPIFALPAPLTWNHHPGISLIGDAAHLMSPFGGNGVNFALLDAAEISRAIVAAVRSGTDINKAIHGYEVAMFERTGKVAVAANRANTEHFKAGGFAVEDIPDFAEEAERWTTDAAAYRRERQE
jgi:2-polyprenyl-6-methoxyphenol hydroxylase-like FAD-dependent oxidoreductase